MMTCLRALGASQSHIMDRKGGSCCVCPSLDVTPVGGHDDVSSSNCTVDYRKVDGVSHARLSNEHSNTAGDRFVKVFERTSFE